MELLRAEKTMAISGAKKKTGRKAKHIERECRKRPEGEVMQQKVST